MKHYCNPHLAQESLLADPLRNLLNRSWQALPEHRRTARTLDVLGAPIFGMDILAGVGSRYTEPAVLIQVESPPFVCAEDSKGRWQEVVSLLVRALHSGGEPRRRASLRIASAYSWKQLDESESDRIAQALWSEKHTRPNDLPGETGLFDWVFLLLPEPTPGLAEQNFRWKWLAVNSLSHENRHSLDEILWQIGNAIGSLKTHGYSLTLSDDEQSYLIQAVEKWSTARVPPRIYSAIDIENKRSTRLAVAGLETILCKIKISEDTAERLSEKTQKLNESGIPAFGLTAGIAKAMPKRIEDIAHLMRTGLASADDTLAENAAAGLHHWLIVSAEVASHIQSPPEDLVREVGVIIAARRKETLALALEIAKWVFDQGSDAQREAIRHLALQGLGYLIEELRYDREHDLDLKDEIPLLRWRSAQLAVSMSNSGYGDDPNISRWLAIADEDPMPEVRYVKDPPFQRNAENEDNDDTFDEAPGSQFEQG